MRRLPALVAVILLLALLAVTPVSAEEPIWIAVPDSVPIDGDLDVVVLTGSTPEVVTVTNCFSAPGEYLMFKANILDRTQKVSGPADRVLATADVRGNLGTFTFRGLCVEPDGITYKVYRQDDF